LSRGDLSEAEWRLLEPFLTPADAADSSQRDNQREKAIASRLFTFVYFLAFGYFRSTRRRFLLQLDLIVIDSGTDEIF
jgi:hypothetical protein